MNKYTTNSIRQNKIALRKKMKKRRSKLTKNIVLQASDIIVDKVLELDPIAKAKSILCYLSFRNEVQTHHLISQLLNQNKDVLVPKIDPSNNRNMLLIALNNSACVELMKPNKFGILEPTSTTSSIVIPNICITPGLAFNTTGERLGYGGGYFDSLFSKKNNMLAIALAYQFQVVNQVTTEPHDQPVDIIVTEKEIIHCKQDNK